MGSLRLLDLKRNMFGPRVDRLADAAFVQPFQWGAHVVRFTLERECAERDTVQCHRLRAEAM